MIGIPGSPQEGVIAKAICEGFLEATADDDRKQPLTWDALTELQREVFLRCARRAIDAGRAYNQQMRQR